MRSKNWPYSDRRYRKLRAHVIREEKVCRICITYGRTSVARIVDHITPIEIRPDLAFERTNLQALCRPCSDSKTAKENRRFAGASSLTGEPLEPKNRPKIYMVGGPPGGGKSTWVEQQHKRSGGVIVDHDKIFQALGGGPNHSYANHPVFIHALAARGAVVQSLTGNCHVRFAWVISSSRNRHFFDRLVDQLDAAHVVIVKAPLEICVRRVRDRQLDQTAESVLITNSRCDVIRDWFKRFEIRNSDRVVISHDEGKKT